MRCDEGKALVLEAEAGAVMVESNVLYTRGDVVDFVGGHLYNHGSVTLSSGSAVHMSNFGIAPDFPESAEVNTTAAFRDGRTMFNDNQIRLDWIDRLVSSSFVLSSAAFYVPASDLSLTANQFKAEIGAAGGTNVMQAHILAAADTLRANQNRVAEPQNNANRSFPSWGMRANSAVQNIVTQSAQPLQGPARSMAPTSDSADNESIYAPSSYGSGSVVSQADGSVTLTIV